MYKVSSDKRQRALHHGRPADWVNGEEQLSAEDQFQQAKASLQTLQERVKTATGNERERLKTEVADLQSKMPELRKRVGKEKLANQDYPEVFTQVARQLLSPVQFRTISAATWEELKRRRGGDINQQLKQEG